MCIPNNIREPRGDGPSHPEEQYRHLLNQTVCRTEYSYTKTGTEMLCLECSLASDRRPARILIHHQLLLAIESDPPVCEICSKKLYIERSIEDCPQCSGALLRLVSQLRREGTWQESNPVPTVLWVSQKKGPNDLIISQRLLAFSLPLALTRSMN